MLILRFALLVLVCGVAVGQTEPPRTERVPVHGDGALAALRAAYGLVYRPRERGLEAIRFTVGSEVARGDERTTFGPWTVDWRKGRPPLVVDADGKPATLEPSFVVRLIRDVIGDRGSRDIENNHLRLDDEGRIEVRVPDWIRSESTVRRSLLVRDDLGRLVEKRFFGLGDELASTVRYTWKKHGKLWSLESRSASVGDKLHVTSYTHREVDGFRLPRTIVATAGGVAAETITYSDYVVNPKLVPAPRSAAPDDDSSR